MMGPPLSVRFFVPNPELDLMFSLHDLVEAWVGGKPQLGGPRAVFAKVKL